jgi:C4-dicarboxylate transporter, DctM subunit
VLVAAAVLPLAEAVARALGGRLVSGAAEWMRLLVLWMTFLAGLYAAGARKHLTLSTAEILGEGRLRRIGEFLAGALSAATAGVLAWAATGLVAVTREEGRELPGGFPSWVAETIMPVALGLLAVRFVWLAARTWRNRALCVAIAIPLGLALVRAPLVSGSFTWPLAILVIGALLLGAPVFAGTAALALLLFAGQGQPPTAVSAEIYRLVSSPTLPAIPLLTACGYVLAESQAPSRLLRFFRALLGWMPGGLALIAIAVCTLFTSFTGGSGLTVVALGGLIYPMLRAEGYPERFSLGLVTATGCLGLLFPPSLPVILYSVVAGARDHDVPANHLYLAGLLPGLLTMMLVAVYAVRTSARLAVERHPFVWRELLVAANAAKWELALPPMVIALFASGRTSMVETAASALAYAVLVEVVLTRDLADFRKLAGALLQSLLLTGSVLLLLSAAMGITSYLVDAEIVSASVDYVRAHVSSPAVFLLVLNGLLVLAGALLDEYSAIVVLGPLVAALGASFGIDPVHLGVVFLSNLQLGYIVPPIGLCLFLASSRFGKPLSEVVRATVPFVLVMAVAVLLITYAPVLTVGVLQALGARTADVPP